MKAEELLKKLGYSYVLQRVPLKIIRKDEEIYPRVATDFETINMYLSALKSGEELPPIVLTRDYEIVDGYHRYSAMCLLNVEEVDALVLEDRLSKEQVFSLSVELNVRHGKKLTKKDFERVKKKYISSRIRIFMSDFVKEMVDMGKEEGIEELEESARWVDKVWDEKEEKREEVEGLSEKKRQERKIKEGREEAGRESGEESFDELLRGFGKKAYRFYTVFLSYLKKEMRDCEVKKLEEKVFKGAEFLFALGISLLREFYVLGLSEELKRNKDIREDVLGKLKVLLLIGEKLHEKFSGSYSEGIVDKLRLVIEKIEKEEKGVEK